MRSVKNWWWWWELFFLHSFLLGRKNINPSVMLGFKFQLLLRMGGFCCIVPLNAFITVPCSEAGGM